MALPSQETITMLALDKHQQLVFRVQFIGGDFNLNLLDEAMAGLTPAEIRRAIDLVRQIHASGITLVIVEHIMEVIVSLASRVIVFHQGREIARGTPQEVTRNEGVIEAYLGKRHAAKLRGGAA